MSTTQRTHPNGVDVVAGVDWPHPPELYSDDPRRETKKVLYEAQVGAEAEALKAREAREQARNQADVEREKGEVGNYYAILQAVQQGYIDVAKASYASAQSRAQFVISAATVIITLYTGLLGIVFHLEANNNVPMPQRGIWAGVFFALSVVLASISYAYVTRHPEQAPSEPQPAWRTDAIKRVEVFVRWVEDSVLRRSYFLHCAIVSLAVGLAFLPIVFLTNIDDSAAINWAKAGGVVVFAVPMIVDWVILSLVDRFFTPSPGHSDQVGGERPQ